MKKLSLPLIRIFVVLILFNGFCNSQSRRDTYWVQPEKVMDVVGVKKGMVIGEAGAGTGYLTFWLSKGVGPEGKIYANDINKGVLETVESRFRRENIDNITTVLGEVADPLFPENELDMIIMLRAFHDFTKKGEWLINAKKYMKPQASLVIIDSHNNHTNLTKKKVESLGEAAGLELVQYETFLPENFIYVFKIKKRNLPTLLPRLSKEFTHALRFDKKRAGS